MDITPRTADSIPLVEQYGPQGFIVNGVSYPHSIIVGRESVTPCAAADFASLSDAMIREIAMQHAGMDILLIGSGVTQAFMPPSRRALLKASHTVIECMDTGAACRTFNILQSEERKVAAILIKP